MGIRSDRRKYPQELSRRGFSSSKPLARIITILSPFFYLATLSEVSAKAAAAKGAKGEDAEGKTWTHKQRKALIRVSLYTWRPCRIRTYCYGKAVLCLKAALSLLLLLLQFQVIGDTPPFPKRVEYENICTVFELTAFFWLSTNFPPPPSKL